MNTRLLQAMILSAGMSTRMRPLTNEIPKILLPVLGKTHLQRNLDYLKTQGIQSVAMNLFHGKKLLSDEIKKLNSSTSVQTFDEEPIRGTGGGILGMKSFITSDHFAVINCDFVTDLDLSKMLDFHVKNEAMATLYLPQIPPKSKYGKVSVDEEKKIDSFSAKNSQYFFGGIHIMSKKIFDHFPQEHTFCIIRNVYEPLLKQGERILGYKDHKARWLDLGEIHLYLKSILKLAEKPLKWMSDVSPSTSWIDDSVEMLGDVTSRNVVIEKNAEISEGTLIENAIVFPNTKVKTGEYHNVILTPSHQIQI